MSDDPIGTPVVTLGFTREELDAMEELAWPEAIETWIHEVVTAALGKWWSSGGQFRPFVVVVESVPPMTQPDPDPTEKGESLDPNQG